MLTDEASSSTLAERLTLTSFLFHAARTSPSPASWEVVYSAAPLWKDTATHEDAKSFLKYVLRALADSEGGRDRELGISVVRDLKIYEIPLLCGASGGAMEECLRECGTADEGVVLNLCELILRLNGRFLSPNGGWVKILGALMELDEKICKARKRSCVLGTLRSCIKRALRQAKGEEGGPKPEAILMHMWETIKDADADADERLVMATTGVISSLPLKESIFNSLSDIFSNFTTASTGRKTRRKKEKEAPQPTPVFLQVSTAAISNLHSNNVSLALPFLASLSPLLLSTPSAIIISSKAHRELMTAFVPLTQYLAEVGDEIVKSLARLIPIILSSLSTPLYSLFISIIHNRDVLDQLPSETLQRITGSLLDLPLPTPANLTAAFATYVNQPSSAACMASAIAAISGAITDKRHTRWMPWYGVLVESAKGPQGRRAAASIAEPALNRSLAILLKNPEDGDVVEAALALQRSIIGKQDLLILSPRQISGLLAGANQAMLTPSLPLSAKGTSATVLAFIVKHYPSAAYSCSATFTSTLRTLLLECLTSGLPSLCKPCTKIMEAMVAGKDIYKKHAVGLLLDYAKRLAKGMNDDVKVALMDAVFALLDTCTKHEIEQLNCLLTWDEKAIFKKIYGMYEREKFKGEI